jgi:ribonucleotide monophosphatase NagD (HAD superfamily)
VDEIEGVLLDIDGVLAVSWEPLPGAIETVGGVM